MAKPSLRITSNFKAAKEAGWETARLARKRALDAGEAEAETRLERIDDTRGYDLPIDVGQENIGFQSGKIFYEPWFGRFFEYGTVRIPAAPFMRPAHRKMRKVFVETMATDLSVFIRARAGVRR